MTVVGADQAAGALYVGRVMHARLAPVRHRFAYRVFSLLLDIDALAEAGRGLKLFAVNRRGLFSFHEADHGPRDGSPLRPWAERLLARAGIDIGRGTIRLLCFPRLFGYVFNPLSVFYCEDESGRLAAIIYEVNNTFGDTHAYVCPVPDETGDQCARKRLHVSPFFDLDMRYVFRAPAPGERLRLLIRNETEAGPVHVATHVADRRPLDDRMLLQLFLTHPLMPMKIIMAIHFEAVRLMLKKVRYVRWPGPPAGAASVGAPFGESVVTSSEGS